MLEVRGQLRTYQDETEQSIGLTWCTPCALETSFFFCLHYYLPVELSTRGKSRNGYPSAL